MTLRMWNVCREYEETTTLGVTDLSLREWLRLKVLASLREGVEVNHDVICLSNPLWKTCKFVRSITTFGSHFRVEDEEDVVRYVTDDNTIAVIQEAVPDACPEAMSTIREVVPLGKITEILEVTFYVKKTILMVASWVPRGTATSPTMSEDMHGFWIANISVRPRDECNKYVFPTHMTHASV